MIQIQRTLDYERNAARAGRWEPCMRCGKAIKREDGGYVRMSTSWQAVPSSMMLPDEQDQGFFAIGPECAKKLPPEYIYGAGPTGFGKG